MAFWNTSSDANNPAETQDQLEKTQYALSQARRRLLGAVVLLLLACALIPWMLDSKPRPWGEDVILRMPKSEQPYQAKPTPATKAAPAAESSAEPATASPAASPAVSPTKPSAEVKP